MNTPATSRIEAIETAYHGFRFRSRLEARWAILFDESRVAWQYEPEGFRTEAGIYLPDFYLPEVETYVEIKGPWPNAHEIAKAESLGTAYTIALFHGLPGSDQDDPQGGSAWFFEQGLPRVSPGLGWIHIERDGSVGLGYTNSSARNLWAPEHAIARARAARFEHGERP